MSRCCCVAALQCAAWACFSERLACTQACCKRYGTHACHGGLACCWIAADPVGLLLSVFELTRRVVKNLTSGKLLLDSSDTAAYAVEFR